MAGDCIRLETARIDPGNVCDGIFLVGQFKPN